ncbi:hypothetical protein EMPS_03744 [Entomortierella parvispora]|uniref:Uncharacterized protein n=1 Tax=Entomortierella parvispora TaxID=205924 RepID=A0A9P3LUY0_9FUNG|nr:hypothetical protein EMPS_03744 [Entomortierella parvispora]
MRALRLVSKQFMATANQFFRIYLTADYAIEHNCIQEAPSIIGGLTLTFPRINTKEASIPRNLQRLELQDNIITLDFCTMVARNCVHLEKVEIVVEGPHSEEVSRLLSCLFSQNPHSAAVFHVKSLYLMFGYRFLESVLPDIQDYNLPGKCTGPLSASDYIPTESPFSRLERLKLGKGLMMEVPALYRVLQLKICPEIAAATSFLGPVYWNRMEKEARLPTASTAAKPSRTLRIFDIEGSLCSVDELYALKEQAPFLEELIAMRVSHNTSDTTIIDYEAFARNSARPPRSLCLKKLSLLTMEDLQVKQLLFPLLDPSILESFVSNGICSRHRNDGQLVGDNAAPSRVLNEALDEMRMDPISGKIQEGFFREFGFGTYVGMNERVDWLQILQSTPRLHRLERLHLPLTVEGFLDMFDSPLPLATPLEGNIDHAITLPTTAITTTIEREKEPPIEPPEKPLQPFPACSSLLFLRFGGYDNPAIVKKTSQRFADYLVRHLSQLKHLDIQGYSFFPDFIFFNAIAPPAIQPSALSIPPVLSLGSGQRDVHDKAQNQELGCHRHRNKIHRENSGLYRLESLMMSLEYLSCSEFDDIPKSPQLMELLDKKDDILNRHPRFGPADAEYNEYLLIEDEIDRMGQKMLLEARPIQFHEDQMGYFLAALGRFQRRKASGYSDAAPVKGDFWGPGTGAGALVGGLKSLKIHQRGMPDVYVEKFKDRVASQFPELEFTLSSGGYSVERS